MGMSDLPEIYAQARGHNLSECVHIFQENRKFHVTTNILHLGDSPASVGNCRNASRVYLYEF